MSDNNKSNKNQNNQPQDIRKQSDNNVVSNQGFMNPDDFPNGENTGTEVPQVADSDLYSPTYYRDQKKHDQFMRQAKPDIIGGEDSESGDTPAPDSDDNTLDNAQAMGLYTNADEEHPSPLGVAEEVNIAEKEEREK